MPYRRGRYRPNICSPNKENVKFEQMGLVWFASFSTFDLEALNQIIILQESAALLIRSSQDFGQIRICRPANSNLPSGKSEFAARQIRICPSKLEYLERFAELEFALFLISRTDAR